MGYNPLMKIRNCALVVGLVFVLLVAVNCSKSGSDAANAPQPAAQATPGKGFTPADVAKLKWIEGTWRGMDGDKPFYERYRIENNAAMVVETLKEDGTVDGEPERFELNNGEFGKGEGDKRVAASEISENHVQFVRAVPGTGNSFRFQSGPNGGWNALLQWPAGGGQPARQKVYVMEPWAPAQNQSSK